MSVRAPKGLYRVFIEDVGKRRFSAYGSRDVTADNPLDAIFQITGCRKSSPVGRAWIDCTLRPAVDGMRLIALPHSRRDLWPNGDTGKVPTEALGWYFPA